ncbi:MAG: hypothetical protein ACTHU1_01040 [Arachnia sp.]
MMKLTCGSRSVVPIAVTALALGLTACGADEAEITPTSTVTVSVQETVTSEPTPDNSPPAVETSEPVKSVEPTEEPLGPNDESGVVDVTVVGDQGVLALQHSGSVPFGTVGPTGQELITGPGGCFALAADGRPQLVVFPAEATFVLVDGTPSATFDGYEYLVGSQFDVASVAVPATDVAGIPERCTEGSADLVIVVD